MLLILKSDMESYIWWIRISLNYFNKILSWHFPVARPQEPVAGLKTGGVVGLGLKTVGRIILKVQQKEAHSTGFRASSPELLFNIHKSEYFCKVTTLESVLISYFCTL